MRESKGAYKAWELWDMEHYSGLGQIVVILDGVLRSCEGTARGQYDEYRKTQPAE